MSYILKYKILKDKKQSEELTSRELFDFIVFENMIRNDLAMYLKMQENLLANGNGQDESLQREIDYLMGLLDNSLSR